MLLLAQQRRRGRLERSLREVALELPRRQPLQFRGRVAEVLERALVHENIMKILRVEDVDLVETGADSVVEQPHALVLLAGFRDVREDAVSLPEGAVGVVRHLAAVVQQPAGTVSPEYLQFQVLLRARPLELFEALGEHPCLPRRQEVRHRPAYRLFAGEAENLAPGVAHRQQPPPLVHGLVADGGLLEQLLETGLGFLQPGDVRPGAGHLPAAAGGIELRVHPEILPALPAKAKILRDAAAL